eukprot:TRINITY_DN3468_c0_g1_i1.p1 TRINITY_DN3468_c0_g1~~TRINITY_DN3468_c0_g1_i1.p1  ORF type:complete len:318 (-),score=92.56 TRINITY_DN3468_c0_g1_i1:215-1168(-)
MTAADAAPTADIQKPKKAASAYWLFTNDVREEVTKASKEKNGGKAKLGDVAKEVSSRWAGLPEAEKKVYEDKAAEDKQRYVAEYKAYLEASDPAGTLRKKYEDLIPKKPMTAYFLFSQDAAMRAKATEALKAAGQPEPNNKQIVSKLGEMWKAASADEKAPFEERYKKDHAEFLEKQKAWQATPEFAEIERAEKAQGEKKKAAEAETDEANGKKRGRSVPKGPGSPSEPKEKKAKAATPPGAAKKVASKKTAAAPAGPEISADVLEEASKLGFESNLRNLAGRPEIIASGKSSSELLAALQTSNGLVNPAKRALLGA